MYEKFATMLGSQGASDAADVLKRHLPSQNVEEYAMEIMDWYGTRITSGDTLPIQTQYWQGSYPAQHWLTVRKSNYDHSSSEDKARVIAETNLLVSEFRPTFCVTSYYDLLNLKGYGESRCIVILMHTGRSFLSLVGKWMDDTNPVFEIFKPADIEGPSDLAWGGVNTSGIMLIRSLNDMFDNLKSGLDYLEFLGYELERHIDVSDEFFREGLFLGSAQIELMAKAASGNFSLVEHVVPSDERSGEKEDQE